MPCKMCGSAPDQVGHQAGLHCSSKAGSAVSLMPGLVTAPVQEVPQVDDEVAWPGRNVHPASIHFHLGQTRTFKTARDLTMQCRLQQKCMF